MKIVQPYQLSVAQKEQLLALWNQEYPVDINHENLAALEQYLFGLNDVEHCLLVEGEQIEGWYFDFIREGERWFAIILSNHVQGRGYGRKLLDRAKASRSTLNGWVIDRSTYIKKDRTPYLSPINFYLKQGFSIVPNKVLESSKIVAVKIRWSRG